MPAHPQTSARREGRYGLVRGALRVLGLAAIAVMLLPFLLPILDSVRNTGEPWLKPQGQKAKVRRQRHAISVPERRPAEVTGTEEPADQAGGEQRSTAVQPSPDDHLVKTEPDLVPAVKVQFPKPFSDEEMSAALKPILDFKIGNEDAAAIKEVIAMASRGDADGARQAARLIGDSAARAFADWKRLRVPNADLGEIMEFRKAHPLFPGPLQTAAIEKSLFLSSTPGADIVRFYSRREPQTGPGKASLGGALIELGERERGLELIRLVWGRYQLDAVSEQRFLAKFGGLLSEDDHRRHKRLLEIRLKQQADP